MRIAVVDPDKNALKNELKCVKAVFSGCEAVMFVEPKAAVKYLEDNAVDVLFTQVPMLHIKWYPAWAKTATDTAGSKACVYGR